MPDSVPPPSRRNSADPDPDDPRGRRTGRRPPARPTAKTSKRTLATHGDLKSQGKLAGEKALAPFSFPWTVVRPPVVYGPRDTQLYRIFRLANLGIAVVFGDGSQALSLIFVDDLVDALLRAAESPVPNRVYFAAHPAVATSRGLVTAVHQATRSIDPTRPSDGSPRFVLPIIRPVACGALWISERAAALTGRATLLTLDKANEFFADAWVCSSAALQRDTGWLAQWDLTRGLKLTAAWYREAGWL